MFILWLCVFIMLVWIEVGIVCNFCEDCGLILWRGCVDEVFVGWFVGCDVEFDCCGGVGE